MFNIYIYVKYYIYCIYSIYILHIIYVCIYTTHTLYFTYSISILIIDTYGLAGCWENPPSPATGGRGEPSGWGGGGVWGSLLIYIVLYIYICGNPAVQQAKVQPFWDSYLYQPAFPVMSQGGHYNFIHPPVSGITPNWRQRCTIYWEIIPSILNITHNITCFFHVFPTYMCKSSTRLWFLGGVFSPLFTLFLRQKKWLSVSGGGGGSWPKTKMW